MESISTPSNQSKIATTNQVQEWFRNNGLNINAWALERGFAPALVYAVLQGKRKCLRGQSHQIAVELGIKSPL